jgi:hypothetical protein
VVIVGNGLTEYFPVPEMIRANRRLKDCEADGPLPFARSSAGRDARTRNAPPPCSAGVVTAARSVEVTTVTFGLSTAGVVVVGSVGIAAGEAG